MIEKMDKYVSAFFISICYSVLDYFEGYISFINDRCSVQICVCGYIYILHVNVSWKKNLKKITSLIGDITSDIFFKTRRCYLLPVKNCGQITAEYLTR